VRIYCLNVTIYLIFILVLFNFIVSFLGNNRRSVSKKLLKIFKKIFYVRVKIELFVGIDYSTSINRYLTDNELKFYMGSYYLKKPAKSFKLEVCLNKYLIKILFLK